MGKGIPKGMDEALTLTEANEKVGDLEVKLHASKGAERDAKKRQKVLTGQLVEAREMLDYRAALIEGDLRAAYEYKPLEKGGEGTALYMGGDWHGDQEVSADVVQGANAHTLAIAERRIERFFTRSVFMTDLWRVVSPIKRGVFHFNGDGFSGHIHDELKESVCMSPLEAGRWLRAQLIAGIEYLLKHGKLKKLVVVFNYGNHTRDTKKLFYDLAHIHSHEYSVYLDVAEHFKKEKRIEFVIAKGYFATYKLYNTVVRFHHGNASKYRGGVGGKVIALKRAIKMKWNQLRKADLDVLGHFHEFEWVRGAYISNGSGIGLTGFGERLGFEEPMQGFAVIDKRRGCVAGLPVYVERPVDIGLLPMGGDK